MKREMYNISMSYSNSDAVTVMKALEGIPAGQRSRAILKWAAAHLNGDVTSSEAVAHTSYSPIPEDVFDDLIDNMG